MTTRITTPGDLDDRALLDVAKRLVLEERRATAALLRALMEIDSRRLYLGEGCASMFAYCTQVLHLSEGGACNRIETTRAARTYPVILRLIEEAALTLTAVRLLAPHLTPENHAAILECARHKSKREIEELVAALKPRPDAPAVVRRLPARTTVEPAPALLAEPRAPSPAPRPVAAPVAVGVPCQTAPAPPIVPARVAALAPARCRLQVTISQETHEKFRRAQALLRHAVPTGDAAAILDRALTLLVEHLERRRFAESSRPRATRPSTVRARYIPAAVRREVWRRDGGRCAFVGAGRRCAEIAFLEFHHVEPYAVGGAAAVKNIELRCRAHNAHEARVFFDAELVRETPPVWDAGGRRP